MKKLTLVLVIGLLVVSCSNKFTIIKRKYGKGFFVASSKHGHTNYFKANSTSSDVRVTQNLRITNQTPSLANLPVQALDSLQHSVNAPDLQKNSSSLQNYSAKNHSEVYGEKKQTFQNASTTLSEKKPSQIRKFNRKYKKGFLLDFFGVIFLFYGYMLMGGVFVAILVFFLSMDSLYLIAAIIQLIFALLFLRIGKKLTGY